MTESSDFAIRWLGELEYFMVRNQIVAVQPAYQLSLGWRPDVREVRHYYCSKCGEVWGLRVVQSPCEETHTFHSCTCNSCGGTESMLTGFEWNNLGILDRDVLAYELYQQTQEVES